MFPTLFLLFLTIPVLEIYLLIKVGSVFGAGFTILIVFATAILGAYLLRRQGLSTFARAQNSLNNNELPAMEMMEGLILLITGALLLTPGFFTDVIGFLCLIPFVRQFLVKKMISKFTVIQAGGSYTNTESQEQSSTRTSEPKTLEGEFWQEDDGENNR